MYNLVRPVLFWLPPEWSHLAVLKALAIFGGFAYSRTNQDTVKVGQLNCGNRVGLAAGFDKDGLAIQGLCNLGFGFLELGGVTPRPQSGNPAPRVFRLKKDSALINRMGLNNDGVDALAEKLERTPNHAQIPIGVNIGRNWDTPNAQAVRDYLYCFHQVKFLADFVTVNISSPNSPNLRELQEQRHVMPLLHAIVEARDALADASNTYVSVFVKISPDLSVDETRALCLVVKNSGCDGIVATNTTNDRSSLTDRRCRETGGLSGEPLFPRTMDCVRLIRTVVGSNFTVIGCGGVGDARSARLIVDAGADLVQLYTAMIYRGPGCIPVIATALGEEVGRLDAQ